MKSKSLFLGLVLSAIFLVPGTPLWADVPVGFVYVAGSGVVLAYSFDDATGALTEVPGSPFSVDLPPLFARGPDTITVDPTGQFLYAIVQNPDGIKLFRIDGATGALTLAPGPPVPTGDGRPHPFSMDVDPTGQFLYVANRMDGQPAGSLAVFRIDADTGVPTPVNQSPPPAPLGASPESVAVDPTGQYVYVVNAGSNDITAFVIDPATGAAITIPGSPFPAPGDPAQYIGGVPQQLEVRADGQFLYVAIGQRNPGLIQQLGIDPGGQLRRVIGSPFPTEPNLRSLTVDPTGQFLYVPGAFGKIWAYTVDFLSGNLFTVPGSPFVTDSNNPNFSIAVDPTARFVYVTGGVFGFDGRAAIFGFRIEADGALTPVPGSPVVLPSGASAGVITTTARRIFPQP
jgi:YVTN family beta-propeller protein